jgi:predicted nucleic acid-binding protein
MTDKLVLDASASLALVLREPLARQVRDMVDRHRAGEGVVIVPEVFWLELTNVLVRRYRLTAEDVLASLRDIDELELQTIAGHRGVELLGLDLMVAHGLSAYDAGYLALAQAEDAGLLTTDRRLARAAGERSVIRFPGAVHEELAPYGSDRPIGALAAHGAYLAELRHQAEAGILR